VVPGPVRGDHHHIVPATATQPEHFSDTAELRGRRYPHRPVYGEGHSKVDIQLDTKDPILREGSPAAARQLPPEACVDA
jgi:hypothetical protein